MELNLILIYEFNGDWGLGPIPNPQSQIKKYKIFKNISKLLF